MVERELGHATIVYEDPDDGTVERTVENEHVAYFQDHWLVKTDDHDADHDVVRRIPANRVYYVERSVEEFEAEMKTIRDQVQSVADDLRSKLFGDQTHGDETEVYRIDVESGEPVDDDRDDAE
ncbi:hypothetical protein [Halorussus marinus]|uniref:hypothetical protein n=1 Tax=Halorussus marinus TaxID=2505976 RepID=UPI00106E783D|nr:hypothetical protein [Halorussus marinus]